MFSDIECKTIHPETREDLKVGESGLLCFRGPNIFSGYLNDSEKTNEVLTKENWFVTGDIGYLDQDDFLFIKGRLSRFSKIGGEMVPHETIETSIKQILSGKEEKEASLFIIGKSDENKGEQLILVIDQEIDFPKLRKNLSENGLPNLWIPKKVQVIAEFPILPTGKVDFLLLKERVG